MQGYTAHNVSALNLYKLIFVGVLVYTSGIISFVLPKYELRAPVIVGGVLTIFLYAFCHNTAYSNADYDFNDKRLLNVFVFLQVINILRGTFFNYDSTVDYIRDIMINPYGMLALIMPFVTYVDNKELPIRYIIKCIFIFIIITVVQIVFNYSTLFGVVYSNETSGELLSSARNIYKMAYPIVFLLLIPSFISKRHWIFCFILVGVVFVLALMGGRRNVALYYAMALVVSSLFYFLKDGYVNIKYIIGLGLLIMFFVFVVLNQLAGHFDVFSERLLLDSRSGVFESFKSDFNSFFDLAFGRGLNGKYFDPTQINGNGVLYRPQIENGFLQIILSGGLISLILYLLIHIRAVFKGLCQSNNKFVKAFALLITLSLLNMIAFGLPEFNYTFLLVWIGIGICNSSYYRSLTDQEILEMFY